MSNWYLIKLTYRFICGNGEHAAEFNEQIRMICAEDTLHAFHKARLIGERETTALNTAAITACWKFIDVSAIIPINQLQDGAELWSHNYETTDAAQYISTTRQQASNLLQHSIAEFTI
jgi:hypothetical protein